MVRAFQRFLQDKNGLYVTDWASVEQHAWRNAHNLAHGVDVASQQCFLAQAIGEGADDLDNEEASAPISPGCLRHLAAIRRLMWNEQAGFFFDLDREGQQIPIKSAALL